MTTDAAPLTRAKAVIRKQPAADGRGQPWEAHGWQCPCGSDNGKTVIATKQDAENAADQHTREYHLSTVLADLGSLHSRDQLKVGATFVGDIVRFVKETEKGTYVETAAHGRYVIDDSSQAKPYTDGPARPE
jgi:hypothetical protein